MLKSVSGLKLADSEVSFSVIESGGFSFLKTPLGLPVVPEVYNIDLPAIGFSILASSSEAIASSYNEASFALPPADKIMTSGDFAFISEMVSCKIESQTTAFASQFSTMYVTSSGVRCQLMGVIRSPILKGPYKASRNSGLFLQTIATASPCRSPFLSKKLAYLLEFALSS